MKYLLLLCLAILFVSCYGYHTGVVQKSEQGFIKFIGTSDTLRIVIDDGKGFIHKDRDKLYQVKPGNHEIKVYKNDKLVVNRVLFIDNNITMEVDVP